MFTIPISRKVVATFLVSLALAGLRKLGVYETSAEVTALIVGAAGLASGAIVGEGAKYVNYFLRKRGLPATVEDRP